MKLLSVYIYKDCAELALLILFDYCMNMIKLNEKNCNAQLDGCDKYYTG